MRKILVILMLVAAGLGAQGQYSLGVKANAGLSKISNSFDPWNSTHTNLFAPSGHAGLFYNLQLGERSVLGAELLFLQIEGNEKDETDFTDINGNNTGHGSYNMYRHISYIGLPIYYGLKLNKLIINVGFQVSYMIESGGRLKGKTTSTNGVETTFDNKYDKLYIDKYDFGLRAGIVFSLNDKFSIEGNYYHGMNDLLGSDGPSWKWKVRQATVGLRYAFLSTTTTETE